MNFQIVKCSDDESIVIDVVKLQKKMSDRNVEVPSVLKRLLGLDNDFKQNIEYDEIVGMKVQTFAKSFNITSHTLGKYIGFLQAGDINDEYVISLKHEIDKIGGSSELDAIYLEMKRKRLYEREKEDKKKDIVPLTPDGDYNDKYEWLIGLPSNSTEFLQLGFSVTVKANENSNLYFYRRMRLQ